MPTTAERNGDFSALLSVGSVYQIYDPRSGVVQGGRVSRQVLRRLAHLRVWTPEGLDQDRPRPPGVRPDEPEGLGG